MTILAGSRGYWDYKGLSILENPQTQTIANVTIAPIFRAKGLLPTLPILLLRRPPRVLVQKQESQGRRDVLEGEGLLVFPPWHLPFFHP